jgi:hypothetical protein
MRSLDFLSTSDILESKFTYRISEIMDWIDKMQIRAVGCLLIIIVFTLNMGCSTWSPSDEDAVRLVKEYYLFYYNGKEVDAKIIRRENYIKEYECYPIEFLIVPPENRSFKKKFYFFKNDNGKVGVREFQYG